ncbi:hypothetical protein CCP3SC1AL1_3970002 [Gammaproteobacteria bacterium]
MKTAMQEVREKITKHFENFRFDKTHHLKFGDIKLTIWEQEEIVNMLDLEIEKQQIKKDWAEGYFANENNVYESSEDYYNKTYK